MPRHVLALVLALVAATSSTAGAQQVAVAPEAAAAPRRHPHAGFGAALAFGAVRAGGVGGWVARIDFELLPVLTTAGKVGPYFGIQPALQAWSSERGGGVGIPYTLIVGVRAPGVRAGAMLGLEAFAIDRVDGNTGVVLYAPLAGARLAFEHHGFYGGADARVTRRWQLGADDFTQWQASFVFGYMQETSPRGPIR